MFRKNLMVVFALTFGFANSANAECTENEIVAKATLLANQIYAHAQKNPDSFLALMDAYEKDAAAKLGEAPPADKECAFYDEWIKKTQ